MSSTKTCTFTFFGGSAVGFAVGSTEEVAVAVGFFVAEVSPLLEVLSPQAEKAKQKISKTDLW